MVRRNRFQAITGYKRALQVIYQATIDTRLYQAITGAIESIISASNQNNPFSGTSPLAVPHFNTRMGVS